MHYKALRPINRRNHSTGYMRAIREVEGDREAVKLKEVRRLTKIFGDMTDRWKYRHSWYISSRNWKEHSKCRHQWEKHELPVRENCVVGKYRELATDHNKKWILERLRQKKTCIFNIHHDECLLDALEQIAPLTIKNGFAEVTLPTQEEGAPHEKKSPGYKGIKGKYVRRKNQRERQKKRNEAIAAVAERIRQARRHNGSGHPFAQNINNQFVLKVKVTSPIIKNVTPLSKFDVLCKEAKDNHIKGVSRRTHACLTLIKNYSNYCTTAKTTIGLAPYEHDYRNYTTSIEQCCAWLTGRLPEEFPPWVFGFLTEKEQNESAAKRVLSWVLGRSAVRDLYGLSRNEVREILHLPANIKDEEQAITAAIARTRHCNDALTDMLVEQIPNHCSLLNEAKRTFVRTISEWFGNLDITPTSNQFHDLLDYFFRSGLSDNPLFSFKGRTLGSMIYLMNQWHGEQRQLERLRIIELRLRAEERAREQRISYENAMKRSWTKRNYDYNHKDMFVFKELITPQDLLEEGRAQHNCVFSYHMACLSGKTSIVSMRGICSSEHLTIEINNTTRSIVQIREACNAPPTRNEMSIVRNFASVKNLIISC